MFHKMIPFIGTPSQSGNSLKSLSSPIPPSKIYFTLCAVSTVASCAMAPMKTFASGIIAYSATLHRRKLTPPDEFKAEATCGDAIRHVGPTLIATALRPTRLFLPMVVSASFTHLLAKQGTPKK